MNDKVWAVCSAIILVVVIGGGAILSDYVHRCEAAAAAARMGE